MLPNYRLPTHEHRIGVRATDIHTNSIYFRHLQTTPPARLAGAPEDDAPRDGSGQSVRRVGRRLGDLPGGVGPLPDQALLARRDNRLRTMADTKFLKNTLEVKLNGVFGHLKRASDDLIGRPSRKLCQDFELAAAQERPSLRQRSTRPGNALQCYAECLACESTGAVIAGPLACILKDGQSQRAGFHEEIHVVFPQRRFEQVNESGGGLVAGAAAVLCDGT